MPTYIYKAKDGPDRTVQGTLDAASKQGVLAQLEALNLSPVWVRESTAESGQARLFRHVSSRDVTVFTLQLASLTRAGVPILRALRTVREQTSNPALRKVVESIEGVVREGGLLSDGMAKHPALFPHLFVDMVRAGESAGVLDTCLTRLAESREKEDEIRRKMQSAVAYPVLVLAVGAATVFILLSFFLPRVAELFQDQQNLPLPTRMLIGMSEFFADTWYWFVLLAVLTVAVFRRLLAARKGRLMIDTALLRIPLLRTVILEAEIGRFCRTFGLILKSGITVDRGLRLSAATLTNSVLREEAERVRESVVQRGTTLSEGLRRLTRFPSFVANMAAVGEESGSLDGTLEEVAGFYEKQIEQKARLAASLLEPLLILVVGAIVGFIVAAMLLPVFELRTGY